MSIYKRPDSKFYWCTFFYKGNLVRLSTKEVGKKPAKAKAIQLEANYKPKKPQTKLDHIINRFLIFAYNNHTEDTYRFDKRVLNRFAEFADKKEINPKLFEDWKDHRVLTVKKVTINRELTLFQSMFGLAVEWKMLDENPYTGTKKFKDDSQSEKVKFFTENQLDLIRDKSKDRTDLYERIYFTLRTGLRRSELINLYWDDINFDSWMLTVQGKKGWTPKNKKARVIPIHPDIRKILLERKLEAMSPLVFPNSFGKLKNKNNMSREIRGFLRKIGLYQPHFGWHTLRHNFASNLVMNGAPLYSVSKLLGHSNQRTSELYSHLQPDHLKSVIDLLDYSRSDKNVKGNVKPKLIKEVEKG